MSIALEYDITVHDALFAALAAQLECELVTADRRQANVRKCRVRLLL
jgi:predicted nucleic acid-binding protein